MQAHDISGMRFGSLVAIEKVGKKPNGNAVWRFLCDCGEVAETEAYSAKTGKVVSCKTCGSLRSRAASKTHGMTETPEYRIWGGIKTRCFNSRSSSFKNYGGRGIVMCKKWAKSFDAFIADMGTRPSPNHSIERKNTNGNYEPGNCVWATAIEQANNKRTNRFVDASGERKTISQAARDAGISYGCLYWRLENGVRNADLLRKPNKCGSLEFNGEFDTYEGWSRRTGIKATTIYMRVNKYGWPAKKALTIGAKF